MKYYKLEVRSETADYARNQQSYIPNFVAQHNLPSPCDPTYVRKRVSDYKYYKRYIKNY